MDMRRAYRMLQIVASASKTEAALLDKTAAQLWSLWRQGLSILALDGDKVVGHAALVPLIPEQNWYEFGVVWVRPEYRHKDLRVALRLYKAMFEYHAEKYILATTTNLAAMVVGWRADMIPVTFSSLPPEVWRETCCCPANKTGAADGNNMAYCKLRERLSDGCFVRITQPTHQHLGTPSLITLPAIQPTTDVVIPNNNIRLLLSTTP